MITKLYNDEDLKKAFEQDKSINILFTAPATCRPCKMLDSKMEEQMPIQDVYICNLSESKFEHPILSAIRSIPLLLSLGEDDSVTKYAGYDKIWKKLNEK